MIQKRSGDEVFEFSLYWYTIPPATQARIMGKKSTLQQSENYEVKEWFLYPVPESERKKAYHVERKIPMLLIIIFKKIIWEYPPPVITSIINIVIKYFRIDIQQCNT